MMATSFLPENYQLTLSVTDNDKPVTELSIVVATTDFRTDTIDPTITFTGTVTPEESGSVLVRYTVAVEVAVPIQTQTTQKPAGEAVTTHSAIQYKSSSTQAAVRLRLNEPLQILKSGSRVFRLTVARLVDIPPKAK